MIILFYIFAIINITNMIEKAPTVNTDNQDEVIKILSDTSLTELLKKINDTYAFWDKVKYLASNNVDSTVLWRAIKLQRRIGAKDINFGKYKFHFTITEKMHSLLYDLDLKMKGASLNDLMVSEQDKHYYLISSIMEEAIASSQMEGASTTRKVAKEMLRKNQKPINRSQQMIMNNYITMNFLVSLQEEEFSIDRLLEIHKLISNKTLENAKYEGCFRQTNDVVVMNGITGAVAYVPPAFNEIEGLLKELCTFANNYDKDNFIHPIIKSIIIHFMIAYIHPFVDGNGRTARSLVYWYLIKNGYSFAEYMAISRIIYRSKNLYEKAFLYVENDDNDLSYFIQYNLDIMNKAYKELWKYLQNKIKERNNLFLYNNKENLNQRQVSILEIIKGGFNKIVTVKEISTRFGITDKTAREDLKKLVKKNIIGTIWLDGKTRGYIYNERA